MELREAGLNSQTRWLLPAPVIFPPRRGVRSKSNYCKPICWPLGPRTSLPLPCGMDGSPHPLIKLSKRTRTAFLKPTSFLSFNLKLALAFVSASFEMTNKWQRLAAPPWAAFVQLAQGQLGHCEDIETPQQWRVLGKGRVHKAGTEPEGLTGAGAGGVPRWAWSSIYTQRGRLLAIRAYDACTQNQSTLAVVSVHPHFY